MDRSQEDSALKNIPVKGMSISHNCVFQMPRGFWLLLIIKSLISCMIAAFFPKPGFTAYLSNRQVVHLPTIDAYIVMQKLKRNSEKARQRWKHGEEASLRSNRHELGQRAKKKTLNHKSSSNSKNNHIRLKTLTSSPPSTTKSMLFLSISFIGFFGDLSVDNSNHILYLSISFIGFSFSANTWYVSEIRSFNFLYWILFFGLSSKQI